MFRFVVIVVPCMLLAGFFAFAQRAEIPLPPGQESRSIAPTTTKQTPRAKRIREGTAFKDKLVYFRQTNDRTILWTADDNQRFVCLENLALERILTTIQENPARQFWKIDGEFTEFRGENFVLIRRSVVAPAPTGSPTPSSAIVPAAP